MVFQTGTNMGIYIWENIHEQHKQYKNISLYLILFKKRMIDAENYFLHKESEGWKKLPRQSKKEVLNSFLL